MTRATPTLALRRRCARAAVFPTSIEPMLAVLADLPSEEQDWAFEYKWDGVRCLAFWDGHRLTFRSRNQIQITQRYPELAGLGAALGKHAAILDGEIVALDPAGRPSFPLLQHRMHVDHPSAALVRRVPVWYVLFDVLYANGASTMELPYVERRARLQSLIAPESHWQVTPYHVGDGGAVLKAARRNGMEGVVAKLLSSRYEPGRRSPSWRKIKVVFGQEFVIGGWIPQEGETHDRVGALLLGYYDRAGAGQALRYAGRVGSGFSDSTHRKLVSSLKRLISPVNPFADPIPKAPTMFVKPMLVAEVQYRRWPRDGIIHQASFKGLRTDKLAAQIIRENKSGDPS